MFVSLYRRILVAVLPRSAFDYHAYDEPERVGYAGSLSLKSGYCVGFMTLDGGLLYRW